MKQKTEVMKKEGNLIKRINILDVVQIVGVQKALNTRMHIGMVLQHWTLVIELLQSSRLEELDV